MQSIFWSNSELLQELRVMITITTETLMLGKWRTPKSREKVVLD